MKVRLCFSYLINVPLTTSIIVSTVVDSTVTTKGAAPPQVAIGTAHSATTGESTAAAASSTQANTANLAVLSTATHSTTTGESTAATANGAQANTVNLAMLSAHNNVEAIKKKPAAGDIFRFQPTNCAEW